MSRPDPHSADPDLRRRQRLALLEHVREAAEVVTARSRSSRTGETAGTLTPSGGDRAGV